VQAARGRGRRKRIALVAEEPAAAVAELLRATGAKVRSHRLVEELIAAGERELPDQIVIAGASSNGHLLDMVTGLMAGIGNTPVVVLCDRASPGRLRPLLAAGVRGVVLREEMSDALAPTIAAVDAGQVCIPSQQAPAIERPVLTIREKQVIGLVALGLKNGEIAERLFLAESTVKSHLSSAFAKLGVRSRHEAIDLIVDPTSGIGMGILALDAEPLVMASEEVQRQ
jgi:DNA-binding NarL/FixJ family response regulator